MATLTRGDHTIKQLRRGTSTFDADSFVELHDVNGEALTISYDDFITALDTEFLTPGDIRTYHGTSANTLSISGGIKTFDTQTNLAYVVGQKVRLTYNETNFMEGILSDYTGSVMEVNIDYKIGSGSYSAWTLSPTTEQRVPEGGTTGQVLSKASSTNYDVEWVNMSSGSSSGSIVIRCGDRVSGGTSAIIRLGNRV
jgi:hypothetical protein